MSSDNILSLNRTLTPVTFKQIITYTMLLQKPHFKPNNHFLYPPMTKKKNKAHFKGTFLCVHSHITAVK